MGFIIHMNRITRLSMIIKEWLQEWRGPSQWLDSNYMLRWSWWTSASCRRREYAKSLEDNKLNSESWFLGNKIQNRLGTLWKHLRELLLHLIFLRQFSFSHHSTGVGFCREKLLKNIVDKNYFYCAKRFGLKKTGFCLTNSLIRTTFQCLWKFTNKSKEAAEEGRKKDKQPLVLLSQCSLDELAYGLQFIYYQCL